MLISSLKLRGFGGASKMLALKELLSSVNPDAVFFQETMVDKFRAKESFLKLFPSWSCVVVDSVGNSGGFLSGWNPCVGQFEAYQSFLSIFLEGRVSTLPDSVTLQNCYGP